MIRLGPKLTQIGFYVSWKEPQRSLHVHGICKGPSVRSSYGLHMLKHACQARKERRRLVEAILQGATSETLSGGKK